MNTITYRRGEIKAERPSFSWTRATAFRLATNRRLTPAERQLARTIAEAREITAALGWTINRLADKAGRAA